MRSQYSITVAFGIAGALGLAAAAPFPQKSLKPRAVVADGIPAQIRYNRDVRPILAENCFACHGPDSGTRKANLRLDKEETARAMRGSTAPIVPGHTEKSEVVRRITAGNSP